MIDLCIYCIIIIQDRFIPTRVIETGQPIETLDTTNIPQIINGEWHVWAHPGDRLPVIACCTTHGTRLCSLHAMTESKDPRNRTPYGKVRM